MPLGQNGFALLTYVTFLALGQSVNVSLTLLNSWLLSLYVQNTFYMANHTRMAWQQLSAIGQASAYN